MPDINDVSESRIRATYVGRSNERFTYGDVYTFELRDNLVWTIDGNGGESMGPVASFENDWDNVEVIS